jgi:hypothetical protein
MEVSKFSGETRISISQAGRLIASLRGCDRPAIATTYRWCQKGLRDVRLEHARVGGSIVTSEEAVKRFISATDRHRGQPATALAGGGPAEATVDHEQVNAASSRVAEFLAGNKRSTRSVPSAAPAMPQAKEAGHANRN